MNLNNVFKKSLLALAFVFTAPAFAAEQQPVPAPQPLPPVQPAPLTEGEMLGYLSTVNAIQIDMGQLGAERAENRRVKNFANKMVRIHTENEEMILDGERSIGSERMSSPASENFARYADNILADLQDEWRSDFDEDYIEAQVVIHHVILAKLDRDFIPFAQNERLLELLKELRADVKYNLDYARSIQDDLDAIED